MDISVLGPLRVRGRHSLVVIPQQRVRAVLTSLSAQPRRVVSAEEIVADVWGSKAPRGAETTLRSYISRLRKVLAPHLDHPHISDLILTGGGGYALQMEDRQLDWCRFVADVAEGEDLFDRGEARASGRVLHRGLGEWCGTPFVDIAGSARGAALSAWLNQLRLTALQAEGEALLASADYERLAPRLSALVLEFPLQERLWEQLVLCLSRGGRRAEALAAYAQARDALRLGLNVKPGSRLAAAYLDARDDGAGADWDRRRPGPDRRGVIRRR
jgi:DNA-binding SARP family transcriptional activator